MYGTVASRAILKSDFNEAPAKRGGNAEDWKDMLARQVRLQ